MAARVKRGALDILQNIWSKHTCPWCFSLSSKCIAASALSFIWRMHARTSPTVRITYGQYRIECDSPKHKVLQVYAGFMIVVYTVGIPAFYAVLLFRYREILRHDQADREEIARVSFTSDLWEPYKPSRFYYEVVARGRRVFLAGVVVFIYLNTAAQIAISLLMAFAFALASEGLAPYASSCT